MCLLFDFKFGFNQYFIVQNLKIPFRQFKLDPRPIIPKQRNVHLSSEGNTDYFDEFRQFRQYFYCDHLVFQVSSKSNTFLKNIVLHNHPAGSSCDSNVCGRYQGFLTFVSQWESMRIFFFPFLDGGSAVKDQLMTGLWVDCAQKW